MVFKRPSASGGEEKRSMKSQPRKYTRYYHRQSRRDLDTPMNSLLGDYPPVGNVPFQNYSTQFPAATPYLMPALNTKASKSSTMGHYSNGYPITPSMTTPPKPTTYNGISHSNSNFSSLEPSRPQEMKKITVSMDGFVQNIPQTMLNDQYGLAALLVGLKAGKCIEPVPDSLCSEVIAEMSSGIKNGYANEPLYQNFSGPLTMPSEPKSFSTEQGHGQHPVCPEYLITHRLIFDSPEIDMNHIQKMWTLKMEKFGEDLLFYVFYTFTRDVLQIMAAINLYDKGWRYHTELKIWLHRIENGAYMTENGNAYQERGFYKCFDYVNWKTVQMEMNLDKNKLEGPPKLPSEYLLPDGPKC